MIFYLGIGIIILLISSFVPKRGHVNRRKSKYIDVNKERKFYCIIIATLLIIVIGFRDKTIGSDTIRYVSMYSQAPNMFENSINQLKDNLFFNYWSLRSNDFSFYLLEIIFIRLGLPYIAFQVFSASVLIVPLSFLIYYYSDDVGFSYFLFVALIMSASMIALRSSLVWGFSIIAFLELERGKTLRFLLVMIFTSFLHITGILFIMYYFIRKIRFGILFFTVAIMASLSLMFFRNNIINLISRYVYLDLDSLFYSQSNTGLYIFIIVTAIISAVLIDNTNVTEDFKKISSMLPIIIVLFAIGSGGYLSRIFYSFSVFLPIIIPKMLFNIKDKYLRIIGKSLYLYTGFYLIIRTYTVAANMVPYLFFWHFSA